MPYTPAQKQHALARLRANDNDITCTSDETGISASTLRRWRDATDNDGEPTAPADVLTQLEAHMARDALTLAETLLQDEQAAPLNQRASALGMLVDRLLKLDALRSTDAEGSPPTIEIVYRDADGTRHAQPRWLREGTDDATHND